MTDDKRWLLAIDTSTEMAGIALYDGTSVSELTWRAGRNQTVALLEQVQHLLTLNSCSLDHIGAIGVAIGPGTFNGLRVGLSTAKGMCYGRGIPIIGINTLDATAYPHREAQKPIRAFVPAGRGRAVSCDYQSRNGRWVRVGELSNRTFAELASGLSEPTLLVGESPRDFDLCALTGPNAAVPEAALRIRRPGYLAELAFRRWSNEDIDEIAALEPVYVHGKPPGK